MPTPTLSSAGPNGQPSGGAEAAEAMLGSVRLADLTRILRTPFYVYNGEAVVERIGQVRKAVGPATTVHYSIKANPSLGLCQLIARQGVGVEVASKGELILAAKAGFPAEKVLFAGPGKSDEELEAAVKMQVGAVHVESVGEMERLARIASRLGAKVRIGIRVNPIQVVKGAKMLMGGGPQQFGIDEERLEEVVRLAAAWPALQVIGLHVYGGTQIFDAEALLAQCHHVVELALAMSGWLDGPVEMIDFGGGFGVPYFRGMGRFELEAFAQGYGQVVQRCRREAQLASARLIIELGRYLVAEAGVYVTRVVDVKESRGTRFIVTDGGMNHHITATGNFGQVFRKPFPLVLLSGARVPSNRRATIVGPCCTPLDCFAQEIEFPEVAVGDLIGVLMSGAYGYSASSLGFLSHPGPAEALTWQGQTHILREPGEADQVLEGQRGLSGI